MEGKYRTYRDHINLLALFESMSCSSPCRKCYHVCIPWHRQLGFGMYLAEFMMPFIFTRAPKSPVTNRPTGQHQWSITIFYRRFFPYTKHADITFFLSHLQHIILNIALIMLAEAETLHCVKFLFHTAVDYYYSGIKQSSYNFTIN